MLANTPYIFQFGTTYPGSGKCESFTEVDYDVMLTEVIIQNSAERALDYGARLPRDLTMPTAK